MPSRRRRYLALAPIFAVVFLTFQVLLVQHDPSPGIVDFELTFGEREAARIHSLWSDADRASAAKSLRYDFGYIVGYVGLFLLGLRWVLREGKRWLLSVGALTLALPLAAGVLDVVENSLLLHALGAYPRLVEPAYVAASWAATAKFLLLGLAVVALVLGAIERFTLRRRRSSGDAPRASWPEVAVAELTSIRRTRPDATADDLVGLSFSGGGIRSATFNLGLLQALARAGRLSKLDYVSTVSGGGYIGSWLARWIWAADGVGGVEQALRSGITSARDVSDDPHDPETGTGTNAGTDEAAERREPAQVGFLRRYSNYLTPKVGMFSADTWATITTYARNFLLNLGVLVAAALSLLLTPRLLVGAFDPTTRPTTFYDLEWPWLACLTGLVLAVVAVLTIGFNLAFFDRSGRRTQAALVRYTDQAWTQRLVVAPLVAAAVLASFWLFAGRSDPAVVEHLRGTALLGWLADGIARARAHGLADATRFALISALLYTAAWAGSLGVAHLLARRPQGSTRDASKTPTVSTSTADSGKGRHDTETSTGSTGDATTPIGRLPMVLLLTTAPLAGALGGIGLFAITRLWQRPDVEPHHIWHALVLGPPAILLGFTLVAVLHIGLMGRAFQSGRREWMARVGAWLMIYAVAWLGLTSFVVYGPVLLLSSGKLVQAGLASGWLAATLGGVMAGRAQQADGQGRWWHGMAAKLGPYAFIVGLMALLALALDVTLTKTAIGETPQQAQAVAARWDEVHRVAGTLESVADWPRTIVDTADAHTAMLLAQSQRVEPAILCLALALLAVTLARRVDVNAFSMHHYYRNRLVRAYLGASNEYRSETAHRFTGFDLDDDVPMSALDGATPNAVRPGAGYPYPIVNTALNLVHGKELAWQERKAASFVVTPRFAGFELPQVLERFEEQDGDTSLRGAFRPTVSFANEISLWSRRRGTGTSGGISLGTGVAISGAAASPNMGYHSTPALTFLLTVFNVRLGYWVGNPIHEHTWRHAGPRFGLVHLISELFGLTSAAHDYLYLSDGGHFENLGIYELVRRRCRCIVASDAGADPDLTFVDLGNAIRKCRTDHGADIDIRVDAIRTGRAHAAIGTITYADGSLGTLLFVKASMTGDEPSDVQQYGLEEEAFPHQTTLDQFFDESQFESYRALGHHIGTSLLGHAEDGDDWPAVLTRIEEALADNAATATS